MKIGKSRILLFFIFLSIFFIATGCTTKSQFMWYDGETNPSETLGVDGDIYLNKENGDLYNKIDGKWEILINIRGKDGADGTDGQDGVDGTDGSTPTITIGENDNWFINGTDTLIKATGPSGTDGTAPTITIGENDNWFIDGVDTLVKAVGTQGEKGEDGVGIKTAKIENGEIIITLTNDEVINVGSLEEEIINNTQEARNTFYAKMKEKAASFGIDVSRLTFNSAISESSGSITSQDMAKLGVMAMGYDELVKIWNQYKYTVVTTGVEQTFEIESTFMTNPYGHYLMDYYYVLGGKTGGLAQTAQGTPVNNIVISVKGPNDSTFVGFISNKFSDTDAANRYRTAKIAFDIASAKYLDKDADVSALEALLPSDSMITILSLPTTGNLLAYNHYDWYNEDSPYFIYDKNGTNYYYTASSWKILTCMTALDYIDDLDERLTVYSDCIKTGSGPTFTGGEQITYRDALHLILLPSSNTSCAAIATAVGQKLLKLESSVSGAPVYKPVGEEFDFDSATAVSVASAKDNPQAGKTIKVRGIVVGGSLNYDNGSTPTLYIKDETTNEICGVKGAITSKNAFEVNMPFAIGDIIEIPVVSEIIPGSYSYGGEYNKLLFTWMGDNLDMENVDGFIAKYKVSSTTDYLIDKTQVTTIIDSQEDLEAFVAERGYHWEIVILRGTAQSPLKAVTGASTTTGKNEKDMKREYIRIFFDNASNLTEQKIDRTSPALSNFGNLHSLDSLLSTLMFNQTEYSQDDYANPYEFIGDVYCFVMGGSTAYYHFIVLDSSYVVPANGE